MKKTVIILLIVHVALLYFLAATQFGAVLFNSINKVIFGTTDIFMPLWIAFIPTLIAVILMSKKSFVFAVMGTLIFAALTFLTLYIPCILASSCESPAALILPVLLFVPSFIVAIVASIVWKLINKRTT